MTNLDWLTNKNKEHNKTMEKQAIFDTVYKHLLTQNKRASNVNGKCRYRTEDGLSCAVGCLIPDDIYSEKFEDENVSNLFKNSRYILNKAQHQFFISLGDENLNFLQELQDIHDCFPVENWKIELKDLATRRNLTIPQL